MGTEAPLPAAECGPGNAALENRRVGGLSASVWLQLWEEGQHLNAAQRAVAWLRAARLDTADEPSTWPVSAREAQLLLLRETAFGMDMEGTATCPRCGETVELTFATRDILPQGAGPAATIDFEYDRISASFRLPTAGDLAALDPASPDTARHDLLARCFLRADTGGTPVDFGELPRALRATAEEEMARRDPHANIDLQLTCPACGHSWLQPFDAAAYLWSELGTWAIRTLGEVHVIASAYGWSEEEVLRLSPTRRQSYLSLIGV